MFLIYKCSTLLFCYFRENAQVHALCFCQYYAMLFSLTGVGFEFEAIPSIDTWSLSVRATRLGRLGFHVRDCVNGMKRPICSYLKQIVVSIGLRQIG